jgi:hypothetical protein
MFESREIAEATIESNIRKENTCVLQHNDIVNNSTDASGRENTAAIASAICWL